MWDIRTEKTIHEGDNFIISAVASQQMRHFPGNAPQKEQSINTKRNLSEIEIQDIFVFFSKTFWQTK